MGSRVSVSRSQVQGLIARSSHVAVKLHRVASVRPPRSEPKKSQFLRPRQNGFNARSAALLSIARSPSRRYTVSRHSYRTGYSSATASSSG